MGENFGLYKIGDDQGLLPYITIANAACGFHASDPTVMANTVRLAKQHNICVLSDAPNAIAIAQAVRKRSPNILASRRVERGMLPCHSMKF
jgi:lactam utilization protein B